MMLEEIVDRANLSKEERSVFWNTVRCFANSVYGQNPNSIAKDLPTHADILQEVYAHVPDKTEGARMRANEEETKLYLCDGHGCELAYPEVCYKNGGECIHTAYPEHSIKKKLGDIFPETIWHNPCHGEILIEDVDSAQVLKHFQRIIQ